MHWVEHAHDCMCNTHLAYNAPGAGWSRQAWSAGPAAISIGKDVCEKPKQLAQIVCSENTQMCTLNLHLQTGLDPLFYAHTIYRRLSAIFHVDLMEPWYTFYTHQVRGEEAEDGPYTAKALGEISVAPILTGSKLPFLPAGVQVMHIVLCAVWMSLSNFVGAGAGCTDVCIIIYYSPGYLTANTWVKSQDINAEHTCYWQKKEK